MDKRQMKKRQEIEKLMSNKLTRIFFCLSKFERFKMYYFYDSKADLDYIRRCFGIIKYGITGIESGYALNTKCHFLPEKYLNNKLKEDFQSFIYTKERYNFLRNNHE